MAVVNGIGRIGFMKGGKAALWKDEDMADTFTRKGVEFIERHKDQPFFLYFATHDIHVPRVPHPRFVGQTTMGARGDAIVQFDWCVGELLATLDRLQLTDNTLVILSSDNGPVLDDGYKDGAVEKLGDHKPAGPFRGGKYTIFEGGTRMPFVVRWPGRVKPGVSDALVSQVDFCASFAALAGQTSAPTMPRTASTCCRPCSANRRPAATTCWNTPARWPSAKGNGNSSPAPMPAGQESGCQTRPAGRRRPVRSSPGSGRVRERRRANIPNWWKNCPADWNNYASKNEVALEPVNGGSVSRGPRDDVTRFSGGLRNHQRPRQLSSRQERIRHAM